MPSRYPSSSFATRPARSQRSVGIQVGLTLLLEEFRVADSIIQHFAAVGAVAVEQIALTWARLVTDVAPHGEMVLRLHCSAFPWTSWLIRSRLLNSVRPRCARSLLRLNHLSQGIQKCVFNIRFAPESRTSGAPSFRS